MSMVKFTRTLLHAHFVSASKPILWPIETTQNQAQFYKPQDHTLLLARLHNNNVLQNYWLLRPLQPTGPVIRRALNCGLPRRGICAANWATRMGRQPHVNAWNVKRVHAFRQGSKFFRLFNFTQAHSTHAISHQDQAHTLLKLVGRNELGNWGSLHAACCCEACDLLHVRAQSVSYLSSWGVMVAATNDDAMVECDYKHSRAQSQSHQKNVQFGVRDNFSHSRNLESRIKRL